LGQWISLAKDPDPARRVRAAGALARLGPEAVATLAELLRDKNDHVRYAAAWALWEVGPPAKTAVPALVELLKDAEVKDAAAGALGGIGPEATPAAAALANLLKDKDEEVRRTAADALAKIEGKAPPARRTQPAFRPRNIDPENKAAVEALVERRSNSFELLDAQEAQETLGYLGPKAVPVLGELLAHQDGRYRLAAAEALWKIDHTSPQARRGAFVAAELLEDPKTRTYAARTLCELGSGATIAVPALINVLKAGDMDYWGQIAAIGALSRLDHKARDAAPVLARLLKAELLRNGNSDVGHRAIDALGRLGPAGVSGLVEALELDRLDNPSTLQVAIAGLGNIGPEAKAAVPVLTKFLKSTVPFSRQAAVNSLARIGPDAKAAAPALMEMLEDKDLRLAAADALKKILPAAQGPGSRTEEQRLHVSLAPAKEAFVYGEPVQVRFDLKNVSKEPVRLFGRDCPWGREVYHFEMTMPDGSVKRVDEPPQDWTKYSADAQELGPGKTFSVEFDLTQWIGGSFPSGKVQVRGVYRCAETEFEGRFPDLWIGEAAGEPARFTVTPAEDPRLHASLAPAKELFADGEPVKIRFDVENVSQAPLGLWSRSCSWGYEVYHLEITMPDGSVKQVDEPHAWAKNSAHTQELGPGKTFSVECDLTRWIQGPLPPGKFQVRGVYRCTGTASKKKFPNLWIGESATKPVKFTIGPG
jgi:HEAT repeat protein